MCVFIYGCIYAWPGQTKNDTDLEFGTHTPIELIKKWFICFFDQITVMASSLEKLPCHMGFSHISSIALSKSTGGEQPARIFLNSLVYVCVYVFMYVFVCVCHVSWPH